LLIRWTSVAGTQGIFHSGSSSNGTWLWVVSSGRLWGRHADLDCPSEDNGPAITPGGHTLVRVWA
jgi:hypothetical protein